MGRFFDVRALIRINTALINWLGAERVKGQGQLSHVIGLTLLLGHVVLYPIHEGADPSED